MADNKQTITKESFAKLQAELDDLKIVRRKEVAQKIKEAREQGDLSENAEYDAAKDEQRDIEARIEELETMLENAEVLDESTIDFEKVHMGCKVTVRNRTTKKDETFQIVDKTEVNSRERRISPDSPIGKALMNQSKGANVNVEVPSGTIKYKIVEIEKAGIPG